MTETATTSPPPEVAHIGVINPYALAAMRIGRRVSWSRSPAPRDLLVETLGRPYEQLVDPQYDTTLYPGMHWNADAKRLERIDKEPAVGAPSVGVSWVDVGDFFQQGTEMTDPIQGAVANCYYIAALSSVAWARTYTIAQRTRATDASGSFVDLTTFFDPSKGDWVNVEVTEKLPVMAPATLIYARSSDPGEIWPGVYEKAFAKWKTNDSSDTPNISATAYGDPVGAVRVLTGATPYYYGTSSMTDGTVWQKVRENSVSAKTFNPMVAWTYSSAAQAPDTSINYGKAGLVANHAYSIIGWDYRNGGKYLVLRNPWGNTESVLNILNGTWVAYDAPYYGGPGFWRSINLALTDGVFSIRVDTFRKYFAGFGLVK